MEEVIKLIFVGLISAFAVSFFRKKGENLADKQDIAEITKKVEEIKHQYNLILEQFKGHNQLKLAALDKRLEVHQKAFSLLKELSFDIFSGKDTMAIVKKCDDWWWENCFYLDAESREAFWEFIKQAPDNFHALHLKERIKIKDIFNRTLSLLQKAVDLPPIKDINLNNYNVQKEEKG